MFRSKKFLFVVLSISCLTVANCQEDKKEDGEKDPVGPATLATPTALFKCDEVTNDPFFFTSHGSSLVANQGTRVRPFPSSQRDPLLLGFF